MITKKITQYILHLITGVFHAIPSAIGIGLYFSVIIEELTRNGSIDTEMLGLIGLFSLPIAVILVYYFILFVQTIKMFNSYFLHRIRMILIWKLNIVFYLLTIPFTFIIGPLIFGELSRDVFQSIDFELNPTPIAITLQVLTLIMTIALVINHNVLKMNTETINNSV